jgi:hypothetical protein
VIIGNILPFFVIPDAWDGACRGTDYMEAVFMKYSISSNFEKCREPVYWLLAEAIVCGGSYLGLQGEIV